MFNKNNFKKFFEAKEVKMTDFDLSLAGIATALALAGASFMLVGTGAIAGGSGTSTVTIQPYNAESAAIVNDIVADLLGGAEAGSACGGLAPLFQIGPIGGLFGVCWVAREVYGESNIKWKLFRSWLLNQAPKWFLKLYINHGESAAKFLKNKTTLKNTIKIGMDYILSNKLKAEYNFAV